MRIIIFQLGGGSLLSLKMLFYNIGACVFDYD